MGKKKINDHTIAATKPLWPAPTTSTSTLSDMGLPAIYSRFAIVWLQLQQRGWRVVTKKNSKKEGVLGTAKDQQMCKKKMWNGFCAEIKRGFSLFFDQLCFQSHLVQHMISSSAFPFKVCCNWEWPVGDQQTCSCTKIIVNTWRGKKKKFIIHNQVQARPSNHHCPQNRYCKWIQ